MRKVATSHPISRNHTAPGQQRLHSFAGESYGMRKIIVSINVTLDGFMAGPQGELDWHFPLWNDEMSEFAYEQLCMMDSILLGRVTYQAMAGFWPLELAHASGDQKHRAYAGMMNDYTKIVFSKTLAAPQWKNTRVVNRNIAQEIARLKQQPGLDMIVYGSGSIITKLMRLSLIDEYVLWVHPIVLGKGKPLFKALPDRHLLKLLKTKTFSSGVVILYYGANN
jgi:dihydrofolate reductase